MSSISPSRARLAQKAREPGALPGSPSFTYGLLRVRRVRVRLAHYDISTLRHARRIGVVNDHVDCAHSYTAVGCSSTWWSASAIAGLLVEGDRADPRHQDSGVRRRIVAHRRASDGESKQTSALRVG